jgi:protocatechuate 3,4-dioxygenase beta subunit
VPGQQVVEKQVSGCQPLRVAIWKAQHIGRYVSIYKSHATPDHGLRRRFSTAYQDGHRWLDPGSIP